MTSTALVVSEPPVTVLEPVPTASFEAVAKRTGRDGRTILTDRICQKRVSKRTKVYDRKCPGLYASIIPAGTATLNFKFTDPATGKSTPPCSALLTRRPSRSRMPGPRSTA